MFTVLISWLFPISLFVVLSRKLLSDLICITSDAICQLDTGSGLERGCGAGWGGVRGGGWPF